MKLVILVLSTLLLHFVYGAAPVGSVTPCSELVIRSGGCNDLACSPSKYFSTSTSETVQIPANGNQGPFVNPNPDASKVLTYRISGVGGTWDQYKQTTTLGLFVDGTAGQTVAAQVTYDFTGDGVIDRTEVFKPFTLDGNQGIYSFSDFPDSFSSTKGFQEWLVSGDANGLQQVPASAWVINMNNGIVELKIWAYAATAVPMTLYINKLSSVSIPYNGYWVAPASLSDACKVPATAGTSSNSVAFFIDAVQDFYLGDTIRAMIGVFTAANASLTLGIPANRIGTDASIMTTLTEVLRKKDWEIACNGFDYEDFSTLNFQQQTTALDNCKNSIQGKLFYDVQTFIPPNFAAAKDTLTALRSSNFSYYIPPRNTENGPFAMQAASFYKYPVQARTTGAVSATFLLGQIRTSVNTDGYAVVGLHPQAFSTNNVLNPAAITELTNLIQQVKTNGWSIVPVRALPLDVDASENHRLFVPNCSCIAFRLDDIQNFAVKEHQKAIMDLFREFDASITVGIIGSMFSLADPDIVGYIQDKMTQQTDCFRFEIANHGYLHEDFTTIDANEQNTRIQLTQGIIRDTLGVTPKSFIPPFNIFNRGTIDALVQNNIKYMSSATGNDPSPLNNTEVYRVPCGAFTSNLTVTQYFTPVTYQSTWLDIQKQLELQGFAAVMMHPYEFGGWDATNGYSASVNPNTLAGLRSLLQLCKNAGLRFVTIEEVETYFNPYHVYPCTGQALINGTAPNQTVVTTGSSQSSQSTQSTQSTQTRSNTQSTQSTQSTQTTRSSTQSNTQSQSSSQSQSSTQSNTQSNSQSSTRSETQSTSTTTTEGNDILSAASSVAVTAFTIILFGLLF